MVRNELNRWHGGAYRHRRRQSSPRLDSPQLCKMSIYVIQASGALHTNFPKPIPILIAKHNSVIPKCPLGNLQWSINKHESCSNVDMAQTRVALRSGKPTLFPGCIASLLFFRRRYSSVSKCISTAEDCASSEFWRSSRNTAGSSGLRDQIRNQQV